MTPDLDLDCTLHYRKKRKEQFSTCLYRHAPESLKYMERVRDPQNFRFCAIPQVMAIGTLALCYNNPKVFRGKSLSIGALHAHAITSLYTSVKLRKNSSAALHVEGEHVSNA